MAQFEIIVELKPEVLDTEGRAILESLKRVGQKDLNSLKVTKRFVVEISDDCESPEQKVRSIAQEYLANPVSEKYSINKVTER